MKTILILLLAAGSFTSLCPGEERGSLLPISPGDLLKCLPAAPAGWMLTASKGEHLLNFRPMSRAERTFTRPLPPDPASPAGGQLETVKVSLIDVADTGGLVETFEERRTSAQKISIGSLPAFRMPGTGESDRVEMLLLDRFILTVTLQSPSGGKVDPWVEKFNGHLLRSLAGKREFFSRKESYDFAAEKIDELNPKRSKKVFWSIAPEPLPEPPATE